MAEAFVSAVLEQLVAVVGRQIQQEVKLVAGVDEEVRKLKSNFQSIQAVVLDAEQRQIADAAVRVWLEKLKDVYYDMDGVLDEWNTAIMKRLQTKGCQNARNLKSKVRSFFLFPYSSLRRVIFSHDIAFKIKAITKRLDDIAKEKDTYNFKIVTSSGHSQCVESTSLIDEFDIFGRDEEKIGLVNKLLNKSSKSQNSLHVISIVGMGGIGKTTLAQLAYNDKEVISNFEKRIWVCVSDPFDELIIAKAINKTLGGDNSGLVKLESVIQEIYKHIEGKIFLLVLDDVWTEDFKKWEPFHNCLKNGLHGSKVLVTTRKQEAARMMESIDVIPIDELSNEQCWSIFRRFTFSGRSNEECEKLEKIGKEIVSKCKGLPLAAKTLGSLLQFKISIKEWENILYGEMWKVKELEEGVFAPLLLSYYDLPSMVKRCFTICAIFPKDFNFKKNELIRLWMAQGYFGLDYNEDIEIIGENYFNTLAMRSFFQEFKKDDDGSIIGCKMHDIVHDVAQFLSKNECCMIGTKDLKEQNIHASYEKARQLVLMANEQDTLPRTICNFKSLRGLRIQSNSFLDAQVFREVIPKLFEELTSLKALEVNHDIPISKEIGKLLHLRFLDVSKNQELRKLPEALCELYNLQTLKVDYCSNLQVLPQGIGKLINLRHLMNSGTDSLRYMPKGIERLTQLRTLSEFRLSGGDYGGKACSLESMDNFQHIEDLGIRGLKNFRQAIFGVGGPKNNKNIRRLQLRFNEMNDDEAILEAFQPPPNLQRLTIDDYGGRSMSVFSRLTSLTNLRSISLDFSLKCLHLPPLGRLPSLETLRIFGMKSVSEVGNEFMRVERDNISSVSFFPKLKTLRFSFMPEWKVWDFGIEDDTTIKFMPSLHTLELQYCLKLKGLPKQLLEKAPLQNLSIQDCPILHPLYEKEKGDKWDHISHIPNVQIARSR